MAWPSWQLCATIFLNVLPSIIQLFNQGNSAKDADQKVLFYSVYSMTYHCGSMKPIQSDEFGFALDQNV